MRESLQPSEVYTLQEIADYLRVSVSTVVREVHRGRLKARKIERQWRFLRRDVDEYLESALSDASSGECASKD